VKKYIFANNIICNVDADRICVVAGKKLIYNS